MAPNQSLPDITPNAAALAVGVGIQSIRRWCEWHGAHLSQGANPGPGMPRRLTPRDLEVLKVVKDLRYQGFQTDIVNERLASLSFPEIDENSVSDDQPTTALEAPVTSVTSAVGLPADKLVGYDLYTEIATLKGSIETIKQDQRAGWWWLVAGIVIGLSLAFVAELFVLIVSRVR